MSPGTKYQPFIIRRQVRICVAPLLAIVYCPAHTYPAAATGCKAADVEGNTRLVSITYPVLPIAGYADMAEPLVLILVCQGGAFVVNLTDLDIAFALGVPPGGKEETARLADPGLVASGTWREGPVGRKRFFRSSNLLFAEQHHLPIRHPVQLNQHPVATVARKLFMLGMETRFVEQYAPLDHLHSSQAGQSSRRSRGCHSVPNV